MTADKMRKKNLFFLHATNQKLLFEPRLFENSKTDPKARIAVFREGTSDFVKFPDYDMSPF